MKRCGRLQDSYMEEYRARGVSRETVSYTESRLDRWGRWLKKRRPQVAIEDIDAEMIMHYISTCSCFRNSIDTGDADATLMLYVPGEGRYLMSIAPFEGASEFIWGRSRFHWMGTIICCLRRRQSRYRNTSG